MHADDHYKNELVQLSLHSQGLYHGKIDGIWGPLTQSGFDTYRTVRVNEDMRDQEDDDSITLSKTLAWVAEKEIGVKEEGKNSGARVREYQKATWLPVGPWAWCSAFVCWCLREAAKNTSVEFALPQTAGAWDFERWARTQEGKGVELIKPAVNPRRGDIVVYKFSHIGIVTAAHRGFVEAVEGNTNEMGGREGDGVYVRERGYNKLRSLIRIS